VVPVHVVTRPPLDQAAEEEFMAQVNRANELIEKHKKESDVVIDWMCQLNDVGEYERETIESLLSNEFQTVLLQNDVLAGVATRVAHWLARNTVTDIHLVVTKRGSSIVVYFRCGSVLALYELNEMITTGFMHVVFTEIIHCLTSSTPTVDVYVKPDDFDFVLSSLRSLQDSGLFFGTEMNAELNLTIMLTYRTDRLTGKRTSFFSLHFYVKPR